MKNRKRQKNRAILEYFYSLVKRTRPCAPFRPSLAYCLSAHRRVSFLPFNYLRKSMF
jgi:hypothetical protein